MAPQNLSSQVMVPNADFKKFLVLLKENDVTSNETWLNETCCLDDKFKNIF